MDNAVAIAAIALTGTIATGFFALINKQNKTHEKLVMAMDRVAESGDLQAKVTKDGFSKLVSENKRGNDESKERNGHLGELIVKQADIMSGIADGASDKIIGAVQHIQTSHVKQQIIDKSTVKNETVENETITKKETK